MSLSSYEAAGARAEARALIAESMRQRGGSVDATYTPALAEALERESARVLSDRHGVEYQGEQDTRPGYGRLPRWRVRMVAADRGAESRRPVSRYVAQILAAEGAWEDVTETPDDDFDTAEGRASYWRDQHGRGARVVDAETGAEVEQV